MTGSEKSALPTLKLIEQEEDVMATFSKVFSSSMCFPHAIIGHLNMVMYWAHNQSLETLTGPYLSTMYH